MSSVETIFVDDLVCRFAPRDWPFARLEAPRIDANWAALCAEKGSALFNGRVLLASSWDIVVRDGRTRLEAACFACDYKAFIAWRDFDFPDRAVWNLFAMAALQAADGAFMVGCMGAETANAGRVYFPAGTPDMQDVRGADVDLGGSVTRELEEETGIAPMDVTLDPGWAILVEGPRIACMRRVRSPLRSRDLIRRFEAFRAAQQAPELSSLEAVNATPDLADDRMPSFMLHYLRAAV